MNRASTLGRPSGSAPSPRPDRAGRRNDARPGGPRERETSWDARLRRPVRPRIWRSAPSSPPTGSARDEYESSVVEGGGSPVPARASPARGRRRRWAASWPRGRGWGRAGRAVALGRAAMPAPDHPITASVPRLRTTGRGGHGGPPRLGTHGPARGVPPVDGPTPSPQAAGGAATRRLPTAPARSPWRRPRRVRCSSRLTGRRSRADKRPRPRRPVLVVRAQATA